MEARLTKSELDNFRHEVGGNGLPSYPHPRSLPDFWEFPTVSMGLGPISAIYQAHVNRYLHVRQLVDTSGSRGPGASWATARWTSPNPSERSEWPDGNTSTT